MSFTNVLMNNSGGGITLTGAATSNLYVNGTLTLTNGIIYTANSPLLIMNAGSIITAGSALSFVDGPMQKIGNTAFVFPVGDAFSRIMPIGISAPTVSSTFQAQYFYNGYTNTTSMAAAPLPILNNVSKNEYWQLDRVAGTGNASVTLNWTDAASSGINSCAPLQAGDLVVARWNGTGWENRSNTIIGGITGSCVGSSAGSVTSDPLAAFSPFAFGSKSPSVNPLPVELLSFTGKNKGKENILEWVTASETNNDYFTLQRSADGFSFTDIATIDGAGNSNRIINYQYTDKNPVSGKNYYRLKLTDFDGNSKYAPNLVVLDIKEKPGFKFYPNPATNEVLIIASNCFEEEITLVFKDAIGDNIMKKTIVNLDRSSYSAKISISDLSPGIYIVTILDKNNNPLSFQKLVKL
jgi:hypothetical protein